MAPLKDFRFSKVLVLLLLFLFTSAFLSAYTEAQPITHNRRLLEAQNEEDQPIKKKSSTSTSTTTLSKKNQTKLIKPTITSSLKNQTKLIKSASNSTKSIKLTTVTPTSTKNKTKLIKPTTDSTQQAPVLKTQLKKLNSTSKTSNSTKPNSLLAKKTSDLTKPATPKDKTTKPITTTAQKPPTKTQKKTAQPSWIEEEEEDDLVAGFRDLPSRFQETLLPDLERISTTSKVYYTKASKEITNGFKPIVGKKYAPTIASIVSFAFIIIPLVLVSLIFNKIKAYFSIQKLLIFIQVYLSIYFTILCLSSLVTGLEPLRFFYGTSQSTYICLQVFQTLAYVLYLLLLLMYLVLVFSTETGLGLKLLGLAQTFVGFAVGLHYYVTVFHRAVLHQPPKTSWKVHAIYATCFLVICVLARAERRKKAYLEEGGEEGKKS